MPTRPADFAITNKRKPCSYNGCFTGRYGISRWCLRHAMAMADFGHPEARHIEKQELAEYVQVSKRLIRTLADQRHPALSEAVIIMCNILAPCSNVTGPDPGKRRYKIHRELSRLAALDGQDWKPVIPREALAVALAVFIFKQDNESAFPRTEIGCRSLEFAIARSILTLRPLRGKYVASDAMDFTSKKETYDLPSTVMAALGKRVVSQLLPFFVRAANAVKKAHAIERYRASALKSPITAEQLLRETLPASDVEEVLANERSKQTISA
jgi:hypothetical protein